MSISFGGHIFPEGVIVNSVNVSILPEISQRTVKISGRDGVHDFGNEIGTRTIEVKITIKSSSFSDLRRKIDLLAEMLYTEEAEPFVILDSPNRYYLAKLSGDTDLDSIYYHAQGTLTFVCSYPYSISTTQKNFNHIPSQIGEVVGFNNTGSAPVFPIMQYVFTKPTTYFHIATDKDVLRFGSPTNFESQTPVNLRPIIFKDNMSSLSGWTNATSVPWGEVQGTFSTNGYNFQQANQDYGSGTVWHGGSMYKNFSEPLQDFHLKALVGLKGLQINEMGKVGVYVRDANGNVVGSISMRDAWANGNFNQAEASAGAKIFEQRFADTMDGWSNFNYGVMELSRTGVHWTAYFAIYNPTTGVHHTQSYKTWDDIGRTAVNPVNSIQIYLAKLGDNQVSGILHVEDLEVRKVLTRTSSSQSPYIFTEGDILRIDNEKALVTLNGKPCFDLLDPTSSFLKFKKGANGVVVSDHTCITNGTVSFTERRL